MDLTLFQITVAWVFLILSSNTAQGFSGQHCCSFLVRKNVGTCANMVKTDVEGERAGTGGYSVLRQPIKWDPNKDPTFDAPVTLKERDDDNRALDETWLNARVSQGKRQSTSETDSSSSPELPKVEDLREELDLFQRTLDTLDYPFVLSALQNECTTVPGRAMATSNPERDQNSSKKSKRNSKSRAFMPLTADSVEGIQQRYDAVKEIKTLLSSSLLEDGTSPNNLLRDAHWRNRRGYKESLGPPPFQGMTFNLESILEMVDKGQVLEGPEILEVSTMMDVLEDVSLWSKGLTKVEGVKFEELPKLGDCITVNATLQDLLHKAFDKTGRLSGTAFPLIGQLRAKVRTLKGDILNTLDTLLTTPSIKAKLATESGGTMYSEINGRIVIPIDDKANNKASVGIVHDSSRSGKTVYVEPTEIVGTTNELRQAEGELRAEETRVWRLLSEQILLNRNDLERSVAAAAQLDLVMARVLLGKKLLGVIPMVGNDGIVSLKNAKHPVLILRQIENVVGSDIDIGANDNQGLVLTGPNSGGKTVILKLLGLVALMARTGIPVPAQPGNADHTPRVDFFNPVLADIGDLQSVGGDLSTFSGHMLVCREVLANAGQNALVLMDELGSGTDPLQGVAIAQALLEALVETGARVAITTHYMELKQLAASDDRFAVGGMQFVNGRPTYKLLPGTVGESFALAVAERLELPQSVLERANELLDQETRQMGDLIRELEDQKAMVDQQVEELADQKLEMEAIEGQMRTQQIKLETKQLSARRDEAKKFAKKLEEKEQVLEDILEKLKANPTRKVIAKSWDNVKFVKRDVLTEAENVPSVVAQKLQAAAQQEKTMADLVPLAEMREKPNLQVGDTLMVCKPGPLLGKKATILQLGNQLQVQVNKMVVRLKKTELALPIDGAVATRNSSRKVQTGPKNLSKAARKAILAEQRQQGNQNSLRREEPSSKKSSSTLSIRTKSNTVDVRGCYMDEAKAKCSTKFSQALLSGRNVVYILHGHGTAGVLKTKIRTWLKQERNLVKKFGSADITDGGDAFTRVELRTPNV